MLFLVSLQVTPAYHVGNQRLKNSRLGAYERWKMMHGVTFGQ
jgi:hypothetical protein